MPKQSWHVDNDYLIDYEYLSFLRRFLDIFFIPLLNSLPRSFSKFIKNSDKSAKEVLNNTTTHKALEALYNRGFPEKNKSLTQKFFSKIWFNLHNSKAVRNRLKLVEKEIKKVIEKIDKKDDDIRVLSVASGSSRAIFEALSKVDPKINKCSITFLDKNVEALEYSKKLQKEILPVPHKDWKYKWVEGNANSLNIFNGENSLDLVEMVGLLDYFDNERVLKIFKNIYKHLQDGGVLITANITDNKERKFITKVVNWPMIYREPEEMLDLAIQAGFKKTNIQAIYEPLKLHIVIIATK